MASNILTPQLLVEELRAVGYIPPGWRALSTARHKPSLTVFLESFASLPKGANMTRRRAPRSSFVTRRFCLGALPERVHCFVHKVALWRLSQTQKCPPALSGVLTPTSSACFFCGDFAFLFPCLPTLAGVAVHSTALAITVQVVRGQECWGGVVSLWSQQPLGCAVRLERESRRTFSCGIWTLWQRKRRTNDGLKSSLKGCPFSTMLKWLLTPFWCLHSTRMVNPIDNATTQMGLLWMRRDVAKCGPTLSLQVAGVGRSW